MSSSSEFEDLAGEKSFSLGVRMLLGCRRAKFDRVLDIVMWMWCRFCCCVDGGFRARTCGKITYWTVGGRGDDAAGCGCGVTPPQLAMRASLVVDLALKVRTTSKGQGQWQRKERDYFILLGLLLYTICQISNMGRWEVIRIHCRKCPGAKTLIVRRSALTLEWRRAYLILKKAQSRIRLHTTFEEKTHFQGVIKKVVDSLCRDFKVKPDNHHIPITTRSNSEKKAIPLKVLGYAENLYVL